MPSIYSEKNCITASEFLSELQSTWHSVGQQSSWESPWIFRGQRDALWELEPSAWRTDPNSAAKLKLDRLKLRSEAKLDQKIYDAIDVSNYIPSTKVNAKQKYQKEKASITPLFLQLIAEIEAVFEFADLADKVGHPIPEEYVIQAQHEEIIDRLANWLFRNISNDIPPIDLAETFYPVFALAQHHGTPTRLLDWTENPLIAAFFAAENVNLSSPAALAVWALRRDIIDLTSIKVIRVPQSYSSYIHAQKGIFTYDSWANEFFYKNSRWPQLSEAKVFNEPRRPLEMEINRIPNTSISCIFDNTNLIKFTLPAKEVGHLLRTLWIQGISKAHLMPTYDNVTLALENRAKWNP